jgi:hypothetical protein
MDGVMMDRTMMEKGMEVRDCKRKISKIHGRFSRGNIKIRAKMYQ